MFINDHHLNPVLSKFLMPKSNLNLCKSISFLSSLTAELSGKRFASYSTPQYLNIVRSHDGLYIDRLTIIYLLR